MEISRIEPLLPNAVTNGLSDETTEDAISAASADFESFLTLLTAQLRNQDPLSPLDSTEFIAQLASFSSVEQQIGTNSRLDTIAGQAVNGDIASFAAWIGQSVATTDGEFRATGEELEFRISDVAGAETATAVIRDALGQELRRIPIANDGSRSFAWDGRAADGSIVGPQNLSLSIEYFSGGTVLDTQPGHVGSAVVGIRGTPTGIALDLEDGRSITPGDVGSVSRIRASES